jgi:hypothetical protein
LAAAPTPFAIIIAVGALARLAVALPFKSPAAVAIALGVCGRRHERCRAHRGQRRYEGLSHP